MFPFVELVFSFFDTDYKSFHLRLKQPIADTEGLHDLMLYQF